MSEIETVSIEDQLAAGYTFPCGVSAFIAAGCTEFKVHLDYQLRATRNTFLKSGVEPFCRKLKPSQRDDVQEAYEKARAIGQLWSMINHDQDKIPEFIKGGWPEEPLGLIKQTVNMSAHRLAAIVEGVGMRLAESPTTGGMGKARWDAHIAVQQRIVEEVRVICDKYYLYPCEIIGRNPLRYWRVIETDRQAPRSQYRLAHLEYKPHEWFPGDVHDRWTYTMSQERIYPKLQRVQFLTEALAIRDKLQWFHDWRFLI